MYQYSTKTVTRPVSLQLQTTSEVAEIFGVAKCTLLKWVYQGKIRAYKVGKTFKFKQEDIDVFLQNAQVRI